MQKDEQLILRSDFNQYRMNQKGAMPLSRIFDGKNVTVQPEDMIFIEKPSSLLDEKGNEIQSF